MAGILTSPKINLQIKTRNAIERRKHGSPNFKEVLRQRCKERMKSKRCALINQIRVLSTEEDVRSMLTNILQTDLKELNPEMQIDERCKADQPNNHSMETSDNKILTILSQEEQWILDEYDKLLESSEALQDILDQVVCPFCEKGCLDDSVSGVIRCNACKALLHNTGLRVHQLEQCLISAINAHEDICLEKPQFTIIPDNNTSNIFLICSSCGYFHNVI